MYAVRARQCIAHNIRSNIPEILLGLISISIWLFVREVIPVIALTVIRLIDFGTGHSNAPTDMIGNHQRVVITRRQLVG
jgi:hypothetical protein